MRTQTRTIAAHPSPTRHAALILSGIVLLLALSSGGCATVRVTDPPRTATEQFLISGSISAAIDELSMSGLRDQLVYVESAYVAVYPRLVRAETEDAEYVESVPPNPDVLYLLGELRARMLKEGVRLTNNKEEATVIVEPRTGGIGIDRYEYLLGIPSVALSGAGGVNAGVGNIPLLTPELAILKSTRQLAFSSVAIVAYRKDGGELVAQSGPFVGTRLRADYWIFGTGPNTVGDIPPVENRPE